MSTRVRGVERAPRIPTPANFAEVWNSSTSVAQVIIRTRMRLNTAYVVAKDLRRAGVTMKIMPKGRPTFSHAVFAATWNTVASVQAAAEALGLSVSIARDRARRVRKAGFGLKRMVHRVDVYGAALTIKEICELTGASKSQVSSRIASGRRPFGRSLSVKAAESSTCDAARVVKEQGSGLIALSS